MLNIFIKVCIFFRFEWKHSEQNELEFLSDFFQSEHDQRFQMLRDILRFIIIIFLNTNIGSYGFYPYMKVNVHRYLIMKT